MTTHKWYQAISYSLVHTVLRMRKKIPQMGGVIIHTVWSASVQTESAPQPEEKSHSHFKLENNEWEYS